LSNVNRFLKSVTQSEFREILIPTGAILSPSRKSELLSPNPMKALCALVLLCLLLFPARGDAAGKKCWVITLEEPIGIVRRDDEIVAVKMSFARMAKNSAEPQVPISTIFR
jgi:hypothetical protein